MQWGGAAGAGLVPDRAAWVWAGAGAGAEAVAVA